MPLPKEYTQLPNSLGGSCPQERLDQIKQAWMDRHGSTEQEWNAFQQQTPSLYNEEATFERTRVNPYAEEQRVTASDKDLTVADYPFCPTWDELADRHKASARHYLKLYDERYGRSPKGLDKFQDHTLHHYNLIKIAMNHHADILRKIKGL